MDSPRCRRAGGGGCRAVGVQISHDEYPVARFTDSDLVSLPPAPLGPRPDARNARRLGAGPGGLRGRPDRRTIKPVDVLKTSKAKSLFVRGPLWCFQVKMHVITANIFLAGLRKIAVMFSAMLHLARVC